MDDKDLPSNVVTFVQKEKHIPTPLPSEQEATQEELIIPPPSPDQLVGFFYTLMYLQTHSYSQTLNVNLEEDTLQIIVDHILESEEDDDTDDLASRTYTISNCVEAYIDVSSLFFPTEDDDDCEIAVEIMTETFDSIKNLL